jgi:hypothetical protein
MNEQERKAGLMKIARELQAAHDRYFETVEMAMTWKEVEEVQEEYEEAIQHLRDFWASIKASG